MVALTLSLLLRLLAELSWTIDARRPAWIHPHVSWARAVIRFERRSELGDEVFSNSLADDARLVLGVERPTVEDPLSNDLRVRHTLATESFRSAPRTLDGASVTQCQVDLERLAQLDAPTPRTVHLEETAAVENAHQRTNDALADAFADDDLSRLIATTLVCLA